MFLPNETSRARLREAENARKNRAEIVAARSRGQLTRRDLVKWGLITAGGGLVLRNGFSPFARSAFADVPTGVPRSPVPLPSDIPYIQPLLRLHNLTPHTLTPAFRADGEVDLLWPAAALTDPTGDLGLLPVAADERSSTRMANITRIAHKVNLAGGVKTRDWPIAGLLGPREGRPPGEYFAHQRWREFIMNARGGTPFGPKGFVVSTGQIADGLSFNLANGWPAQDPNAVWTFGEGRFVRGSLPPALIQARYGEPVLLRHYNNLPFDPAINGGFGRNEPATHCHNAHNGAESDGANNAHFFPGEYYDYLWSTILARSDEGLTDSRGRDLDTLLKIRRRDPRASSPTDTGGIELLPGDFREIQGTLWFHDHRIAYTAENVYKGYAALLEYFSGPDRGYERPDLSAAANAVNLRLPSGWRNGKTWGNRDFDVYLLVQDVAFNRDGRLLFDIFDTDGFLGDVMHVNFQWKPTFKVLPRKYRFRILSAGMSRWIRLAITDSLDPNTARAVPFTQIANDGNLFPRAVRDLNRLDVQGTAERYDIVIDFSRGQTPWSQVGKKYYLTNLLQFSDGRKPDESLSIGEALSGTSPDPAVGAIMQFEVVSEVESIDEPGTMNTIADACGANDTSQVPDPGDDWQIPIVDPVRTRIIEFKRSSEEEGEIPDSGLPFDHMEGEEPWGVRVTTLVGQGAVHLTDMRRSANLPRPGDVEHWIFESGGGWGHPVHLHFEEAVTMNRQGESMHPAERRKRKDVWHIGTSFGDVQVQTVFSEFGGAYVNHCHNTVHEDNAMLLRYDLIRGNSNAGVDDVHITVLPTPDPRPDGVTYVASCSLPEANPQGFDTGVALCPEVGPLGPVEGGQGAPPGGWVDLSGSVIKP